MATNVFASVAFAAPYCSATTRKPQGYWKSTSNLYRELKEFRASHGGDIALLPTASELLDARRFDLYRAVQRQGGFAACAHRLGLSAARRPRGYWSKCLRAELRAFAASNGTSPESRWRWRGGTHGWVESAEATKGHARNERAPSLTNGIIIRPPDLMQERAERRTLGALKTELRKFAGVHCDGRQPLQRELVHARRHDLLNALRAHGGLCTVSERAGLMPSGLAAERRPRGYWERFETLEVEMRAYTSNRGIPGLMPRRDQLLRVGRRDLCYAIEKHGGFS
eukprot:IDg16742t1